MKIYFEGGVDLDLQSSAPTPQANQTLLFSRKGYLQQQG